MKKMRRESTRLSEGKNPMRKHSFWVMNCCVQLLLVVACLPPPAHTEEAKHLAIFYERTWVGTDYKHTTYGAAWNFKTGQEARNAALKECRKKARNPRNCGHDGNTYWRKGKCVVIAWTDYKGYFAYRIGNNEREKALARSSRNKYGRPRSSKFELLMC